MMEFIDLLEDTRTIQHWGDVILHRLDLDICTLRSSTRTKNISKKKITVYFFLREICGYSFHEVADYCNKDHTTIVKSIDRNKEELGRIRETLEGLKGAQ